MLPVQKLPHQDAGGAQAKTMTAIGIEENGPVVELLPEHDERIPYGFLIGVHGSAVSSLDKGKALKAGVNTALIAF